MSYERLPSGSTAGSLRRLRAGLGLTLLIVAWGLLVAVFCWILVASSFKREAADSNKMVTHWPDGSQIATSPGRPTVLLFLHPKCPCSAATLAELERTWVLNYEHDKHSPRLVVVATVPSDQPSDWLSTGTVEEAQRIAGAKLFVDAGGREAARFGATTSGTIMWFDANGERLYGGGITASRGHEGANAGRDCLEQLLRGDPPAEQGLPAFGCKLCLPNRA